MKTVEIMPREKSAIYGALVKREAEIRRNGRGTFVRKGPSRQTSAVWTHKKFTGTVSLKREEAQAVSAKIRSRVPEDERRLLNAFLGFVDRQCGDQVATITIRYH
jgi:hypothetical protein